MTGPRKLMDRRWAKVASAVIDRLFLILTGQHDHCRKAFQNWANPMGGLS